MPWVVLEVVPVSAAEFERICRETCDGWGMGLITYRVLHAPQIDVYSTADQVERIVEGIREFPAQRLASFKRYERFELENRFPNELLDQMEIEHAKPLCRDDFSSPILLVTADTITGRLTFLGAAASFDTVLEALVARTDHEVNNALAAWILYTCHGKPTEMFYGTRGAGRAYSKSSFTTPFHYARLKQLRAVLRERYAGDSSRSLYAELIKLLHGQIPVVIQQMRRKPPRKGHSVHSTARSRLAEKVSDFIIGESRRSKLKRPKEPWWDVIREMPPRFESRFLESLTPAERRALISAQKRESNQRETSTRRVHLFNASKKLQEALTNWQERQL